MKNLFKNLMLVAVAAMAFTACQNDNEEVNKVDEVTVIEFTADFDATRSGFTGEKGETGYQSVWNGGEKVQVYVGDYSPNNDGNITITTEDGVQGRFTAEFSSSLPAEGNIEAYVPAEGWANVWNTEVSANVMTPQIPGTQTPSANSVDPAAHLLKSVQAYTGGVAASANLVFEHGVAYAKMTLNLGEVVAFANIASVVVEIDDNQRYTLLPTDLTEPTFWFACKACEPTAMTVTITDKGDVTYVKELDLAAHAANPLTFVNGVVSTFTVGNFEEVVLEYVTGISAFYNEYYGPRYEFTIYTVDGAKMIPYFYVTPENGMIPEGEYENESGYNCGFMYADGVNSEGYADFAGCYMFVSHLEEGGYEIYFILSAEDDYEFTYSGVIEGINNPPAPKAIASEATLATLNGSYNGYGNEASYRFEYEVAGDNEDVWAIEVTIYGDDAMGIIPAATYTNLVGTATLKDTAWEFAIDDANSSVTVAHDGENYVVTFDLVDLNGSTYKDTFTGVITKDEYNGLLQPGAATPLATPTNVAYELVDFTKARITWDAVDGAGSYELYYEYWDNASSSNVKSADVTTNTNSYTFEDLTIGNYYTVYVKALPADEEKNTASENYGSVYNVQVFADHSEMATTYTFNTVEKAGKNTFNFSDGANNLVIAFPQELENVPAGTYYGGYESGMIYPYNCSFNSSSIYSIDYVVVEGNYGEEQTVTMVLGLTYGEPSIKAVFTGVLEEESNAETVAATSFTFLGDWNTVYSTTGRPSGVYKVTGENFDIDLAIRYNGYNKETGAFIEGTYTYAYNGGYYPDNGSGYVADDFLYDGNFTVAGTFNGNALTNNYDSTLVVDGSGITLTLMINYEVAAVITWSGQPTVQ